MVDNYKQRKRQALMQIRKIEVPKLPISDSSSVQINDFANARAKEIEAFEQSLISSHSNIGKTVLQTLPKRLRRRAASHNVKRLPKAVRSWAIHKLEANPDSRPRLANLKRKRNRFLKRDYLSRQKTVAWLPTHIWHAKRFKMISKYNYKLPLQSNEKSFKRAYRFARRQCAIHDASYLSCFCIEGLSKEEIIKQLLPFIAVIGRQEALDGSRCISTVFRNNHQIVGPIEFLWMPESLYLWAHPLCKSEIIKVLQPTSLVVTFPSLGRISMLGPQSTHILQSTLIPNPGTSLTPFETLAAMVGTTRTVAKGCALHLSVQDPRIAFPPKIKKRETIVFNASRMQSLLNLSLSWPMNEDPQRLKLNPRQNPCKRKKLRPEAPINLILFTNMDGGFEIILPIAFTLHFWHTFIFAGAHALSLTNTNTLAQTCVFPRDYIGTYAYDVFWTEHQQKQSETLQKKPKSKRGCASYPAISHQLEPDAQFVPNRETLVALCKAGGDTSKYYLPVRGSLQSGKPPRAYPYPMNSFDDARMVGLVTEGGYALDKGRVSIFGICRMDYLLEIRGTAHDGIVCVNQKHVQLDFNLLDS